MMSPGELNDLIAKGEGKCLEFKDARGDFSRKKLFDYCAALANEGGGHLLLGVSDSGSIVGTTVYKGVEQKLPNEIYDKIKHPVEVEVVDDINGRVLVFYVRARPLGKRIRSGGSYQFPMRMGESLREMTDEEFASILSEVEDDFSAKIIPNSSIKFLSADAIREIRQLYVSQNESNKAFSDQGILRALGLMTESGEINFAALILLGRDDTISNLLPGDEIIFEWRRGSSSVSYDFRKEWRTPFILAYNDIWETLNARNSIFLLENGLFRREIPAFRESALREALLNAVTHRDYRIVGQSTFIRADSSKLQIVSPGSLPAGVTPGNILKMQKARNRRLAEVFQKIGLVERSGLGVDRIFETTMRDGKGVPDFEMGTDSYQVTLTIPAQVKDKDFIVFLDRISRDLNLTLSVEEVYELEQLRVKKKMRNLQFKERFLEAGIIERLGKTNGTYYMLSHHYYAHEGKVGDYIRNRGLARDAKKALIVDYLKKHQKAVKHDFIAAFSDISSRDVANLLQELRTDGKIFFEGRKKNGFWRIAN